MEKLNGESLNIVNENVEKLKELFPEAFSEGKLDFSKLEEELGEFSTKESERYNFTWNGKQEAKKIAQTPSTGTLRPCKEESKNWDSTQNLYIEGDNLEVLKLLQKSYHKQVKMIYIDPPYNTGKDFVYKDNFKDNIKNYMEQTGQVDSDGNRLSTNSDTNGRYHSDWLSMMYPRLKLARNLLKDDGVIFISIDDNEVANLRKLCDEIFGEDNFIAQLAVQLNPRGRHLDKFIAKTHESVLIFGKNLNKETTMYGVEKEGKMVDEYNREDKRGKYRLIGLRNRNQAFNPSTRPNLYYPIYINPDNGDTSIQQNECFTDEVFPDTPDGTQTCWTWGKDKVVNETNLLIGERTGAEWRVYRKDYLFDISGNTAKTLPKSLWIDKEINNDYGRKIIKNLFNSSIMDFPKALDLIDKLLNSGMNKEDIVLDFFSGSATTAHAVMDLNVQKPGQRKYICVQLPEETPEKSEAYKAGYKNICEIGKERIRRAGDKIIADNPDKDLSNLDIGFKVYKLDSSNIKEWDSDFDNLETNLLDAVDNIKSDRTSEDLLYEILLKYGLDLTLPIEEKTIEGKTVYIVGFGALIVCLDKDITTQVVEAIAKQKENYNSEITRVVFKDSSFKDAIAKTNAIQILNQSGIDEVVSV